ncbi:bifunctional (p)ppGpp synthetase/guanosine-3',5'-bis(diphosphate) 3'-pyrophosphohydrolase [Ferrovibrio sp.]|uniref:RelA/SpoT family protein n=1 Tax=Ferrovibrio sp. TaxID=1917215 RepID=UPI001B58EC53|nr:bifunctional (p)ppGpp synthetase/guanosine-3',5'-bis(diphosphate) 3'-pyrophosphohydrolase [Ferrovibrio sp.]MBP7064228.1 bifunctional (p)ppGpp synthetase/guanosine-3',5'-bis(diphosphate) 3'-pyrophosphohydrolase [Ferrovibrio sp.]
MLRQVELVEKVLAYDPSANEDLLNRAYVFSMMAHGTQLRASGDPYFSHPVEVAGILAGMKLDDKTIATGLLHDTLEDTVATPAEIEKNFGGDVLRLVDGVTKLSRIEQQSDRMRQAENFRKLLLAMSNDIRVLLVKLADRLHNMRTLHYIKTPEKRARIARETMEIYVPLADRIGMQELKEELEDLAFGELNGDARASILTRLEQLRTEGGNLVDRISDRVKRTLAEQGLDAWVSGREKRPFSIWEKMQRKNIPFEQLSDIMAFRIVVRDIGACYQALGIVHGTWPSVPGRFKDYISTPKQNGYRSLHTTVIGPENKRIEIQIRTQDMHEVADLGVAAHWQYKQDGDSKTPAPDAEAKQYRWLRELLEILEQASDPEEFLEHTKLNMFQDQVFCFSPKGDLIALPRDATVVDFAYAVHSGIGDTAVGAKVNGRVVPLRTVLRNGDQVEILRSKVPAPNSNWLHFVKSGRAKSCINRFIRQQQRGQYIELGKAILKKTFHERDHQLSEKGLDAAVKVLKLRNVDDVYVGVGDGSYTGRQVLHIVYPGEKEQDRDADKPTLLVRQQKPADQKNGIPIRGLIPGMAMHFAGCCHPLPGDRIVGIVTTGKGVTIHTIDCDALGQFTDQPERWLDIAWDSPPEGDKTAQAHLGRVLLLVANEPGSLSALSTVIAKHKGNITNLKITNRTQELFEMFVDIEVRDVKHLSNIIAALRATPNISSVERARG